MKPLLEKYLKALRLELEDLEHDIDLLVTDCREKFKQHNITEHVCFQNIAVFRNEHFGVQHFIEIIDSTNIDDFETLDELVDYLRKAFAAEIVRAGLAPAANVFAERKIKKVKLYTEDCLTPAGTHAKTSSPE